jgi:hypothetical protein
MSRIFINYRRDDTSANAGRLYEWLAERYGEDQVFMDVDTIEPGMRWREAIDRAVGSSTLVLALIGSRWLSDLGERVDDPADFMRYELETALQRDVRIIPVLVEGARMPRSDELPESLVTLTEYQAFEVRNERFRFDKEELLKRVDRALGIAAGSPAAKPELAGVAAPGPAEPSPWAAPVSAPASTTPPAPDASDSATADAAAWETEHKKWNWGAFLLTWVWGLGHGVYRSFLTLIPIYGIYEWIMLGKNGNQWAYEKRPSASVEKFRSSQRKWAMWGIIVDAVVLIAYIAIAGSADSSS